MKESTNEFVYKLPGLKLCNFELKIKAKKFKPLNTKGLGNVFFQVNILWAM